MKEKKQALRGIGLTGGILAEVRRQSENGPTETYRGMEYRVEAPCNFKLELVVPDSRAEEVIDTLIAAARIGETTGGTIFVSEVLEAVRMRNYERGEQAL